MLKLRNISKYYHSNDVVALGLRKVNLDFKLGEFVAVTGESGSGKSTLLNVISGLDTYEDGEMYVNDEETSYYQVEEWESYRRQYIGFVFQNYNIIDSYSVLENVMVALQIQGYDAQTRRERALELIEKVGLTSHANHKASKLSGGQKQRAVIARALAKDCPIIVCDEPTGNLDFESSKTIMKLLSEISKEKLVIVVTHNYEEVEEYATRKIRLFDGEIVEDKKIKSRNDVKESVTIASYFMNIFSLMSIALRNLVRTPRRTIFTCVVGLFISLAFLLIFGSYMQSQEYESTRNTSIFTNAENSRIVVNKFDRSEFTADELTAIENISKVNAVFKHDVMMDTKILVYLEETWQYYDQNDQLHTEVSNYAGEFSLYPISTISKNNLSAGRLPENEDEVVIDQNFQGVFKIGEEIEISNLGVHKDDSVQSDKIKKTVVGITTAPEFYYDGGRIYFHDDYFRNEDRINKVYLGDNYNPSRILMDLDFGIDNDEKPEYFYEDYYYYRESNVRIVIDETLADGSFALSDEYFYEKISYEHNPDDFVGKSVDVTSDTGYYRFEQELKFEGLLNYEYGYVIYMNQNTYDGFVDQGAYQITVLVEGAHEANAVISKLESLGYNAIYPSGVENPEDVLTTLFQNIMFGFLMSLFTFVLWFISYLVLRNVQRSKKRDYLIFRSIGASQKDLNKVTILELGFSLVFSYFIAIIIMVINGQFKSFIPNYLRYFDLGTYLAILGFVLVLSYGLSVSFNKRIFSKSVITSLKAE